MKRRSLLQAGLATSASWLGAPAGAQARFPDRAITIVNPAAPGGSGDVFGRKFAERLGSQLQQNIVVENRAGAAGAIGAASVARAKPDGYTLLMGTTGSQTIAMALMENPAYDPVRDFAYISVLSATPMNLLVNPAFPAKTVAELIAVVKATPGKYSYASAGPGGLAHLTAELFKKQVGGLDLVHVPYKGGAPALQDVISGQVPMLFDALSANLPFLRAGKIRILALCTERRSAVVPEIPTMAEAGVPGLVSQTANIFAAPRGTPPDIVRRLSEASAAVMQEESFRKELEALTIQIIPDTNPQSATEYVRQEVAKWTAIIKANTIKAT